jgi:opacity protein-like surface antigen
MRYLAISAMILVSAFAARTVRADDDEYNRLGGYIGVGASRSIEQITGTLGDAVNPLPAQVGDTWGANARAGYRFHKYLAAEVEYEWMKDFPMWVAHTNIGKLQTQTATANLKIIAPYGAFQPYLLVGAGAIFTTVSHQPGGLPIDFTNGAFAARFGAGLDYWITPNVSLNLGAEMNVNSANISSPLGTSRGLDYFAGQFGFGYRF